MVSSVLKGFVAAVGLVSTVVQAAAVGFPPRPEVDYFAGINLGTQDRYGNCKSTEAWQQTFARIKELSDNKFTVMKFFTTAGCDLLMQAAPAAMAENVKIWAGVWAFPDAVFDSEKAALERAIRAHGASWLAGVNVGSESLYREEIDPRKLAGMIYDVKGMVQIALNATEVPVGTADTWTAWERSTTKLVIDAVDVALVNAFPYWQGAPVDTALETLQNGLQVTRHFIGDKPMIVGETGWPTDGDNFGGSIPSTENLQAYWDSAACYLQNARIPWIWFSGFDEPYKSPGVEQNFGIATADMELKISLEC